MDRYKVDNENVTYWDPIRGRELVGYVPWAHDLPDDNATYAQAWKHLLDSEQLAGPYGLRTNEPSYEYYMRQYRYEESKPECQWNGPVWPYQTTQILIGLANLLDHYPTSAAAGVITNADYTHLLKQYALLHYNPECGGILDLEENYYDDTGYPIVGLDRSPHYFHSGFVNLILSGFAGIRPRADDVLEVNPIADAESISYFRVDRVLYHGHDVAVQWDSTGEQYGGDPGLLVEVDAQVVATAPEMRRSTANITRETPSAIYRPIAKSIRLQVSSDNGDGADWPQGNVSVPDADPNAIQSAIDSRTWFFPEADIANGWDTPADSSLGEELWYQITFGTGPTATASAEIAFFANSTQGFDVPEQFRVQTSDDSGSWNDVPNANYTDAVANGITHASWDAATTQIRLVFTPKQGTRVRLVEFKVFSEVVND